MGKKQTYLEIEKFKNRIIDSTLLVGALLGIVAFVFAYYPIDFNNLSANFIIDCCSFLLLFLMYSLRRRVHIEVKAGVVLVVLLAFALVDAVYVGLFGFTSIILTIIPFYSFLVFGVRKTIVVYLVSILSYLGIGLLHVNGVLVTDLDTYILQTNLGSWVENTLLITVVSTVTVMFTRRYNLELNNLIGDLEKKNDDLLEREHSLEIEKAFNNGVIDSMPGIFNLYKKSEDGFKLVRWNRNTLKYSGLSDEELMDQDPLFIIHPDYRPKIQKVVENLGRGQLDGGSARSYHTTDETMNEWFYFSGYPARLGDDEYFLGTGIEISEQIELERLFKEEKLLSNRILDIIPGVFYLCEKTADGFKLIRWNKNLEKETGYAAEELMDFRPIKLFPIEYHRQIDRVFIELKEKGYAVMEAPMQRKHEIGDFWYFVNKLFKTHEKEYLIGVGFDISDRKVMERELEHRNLNLKDMLQDMQSRNQKLAEYAFINSHLLRAPLARILGLAEMVSKEVILSEHQELIESFKTSAEELDAIVSKINEILDQRTDLNRQDIIEALEQHTRKDRSDATSE